MMKNKTVKSESTVGERETFPKFTPGPWSVEDNRNQHRTGGFFRVSADGFPVCDLFPYRLSKPQPPIQEMEADARLIAAAPELYEALQHLVSAADYLAGQPMNVKHPGWDRARAALAKATGTEPPSYGPESEVHSDGGQS